jgi:hypothetical protein
LPVILANDKGITGFETPCNPIFPSLFINSLKLVGSKLPVVAALAEVKMWKSPFVGFIPATPPYPFAMGCLAPLKKELNPMPGKLFSIDTPLVVSPNKADTEPAVPLTTNFPLMGAGVPMPTFWEKTWRLMMIPAYTSNIFFIFINLKPKMENYILPVCKRFISGCFGNISGKQHFI